MWYHITLHPRFKLLGTYETLDFSEPHSPTTKAHEFFLPDEETYNLWVVREGLSHLEKETKRLIKDVRAICKKYDISLIPKMKELIANQNVETS